MGYAIMMAIRFGVARGIFSNEAGLGSAPIAHAASTTKDPVAQGVWGVFEVFVDTLIICTLTALVILTSGITNFADFSGVDLTKAGFGSVFGVAGEMFIAIAILCFALSTILGWSYYGQQSLGYLTKNNNTVLRVYQVVFVALTIVGAIGGLALVWDIADTLNGLMAIPNLIALILLSKVVVDLTRKYLSTGSSI